MNIKTKLFIAFTVLFAISFLALCAWLLFYSITSINEKLYYFIEDEVFHQNFRTATIVLTSIGGAGMFITACLPDKKDK